MGFSGISSVRISLVRVTVSESQQPPFYYNPVCVCLCLCGGWGAELWNLFISLRIQSALLRLDKELSYGGVGVFFLCT